MRHHLHHHHSSGHYSRRGLCAPSGRRAMDASVPGVHLCKLLLPSHVVLTYWYLLIKSRISVDEYS